MRQSQSDKDGCFREHGSSCTLPLGVHSTTAVFINAPEYRSEAACPVFYLRGSRQPVGLRTPGTVSISLILVPDRHWPPPYMRVSGPGSGHAAGHQPHEAGATGHGLLLSLAEGVLNVVRFGAVETRFCSRRPGRASRTFTARWTGHCPGPQRAERRGPAAGRGAGTRPGQPSRLRIAPGAFAGDFGPPSASAPGTRCGWGQAGAEARLVEATGVQLPVAGLFGTSSHARAVAACSGSCRWHRLYLVGRRPPSGTGTCARWGGFMDSPFPASWEAVQVRCRGSSPFRARRSGAPA